MSTGAVRLIGRRLAVAASTLFAVSILLFAVLRLIPIDPLAMSVAPNARV